MPYTFPVDANGKAGAVKPTSNGNDFFVPTREQGSETLKGAVQNIPTSGVRVQMSAYVCREITIIAKEENAGVIYVGGIDVSSTVYGIKLKPRDSITLKVSNPNMIYLDASISGEGVSYFAI